MRINDVKQLVRVYTRADEIGLAILACSVRRALMAIAKRDWDTCKSRLKESLRFCEIAKSGTEKARLAAPGFKMVICRILAKIT